MRLNFNLILSLIFFISLLSCKQDQKHEKDIKGSDSIKNDIEQPAVLIAHGDDPKAFEYFNVMDNSYLFGTNHKDVEKKIFKDSMILKLNSIVDSQLMEIIAFGNNKNYRTKFFIEPGDTIRFEMKNGRIYSLGLGDLENSVYQYLDDSTPSYAENNYLGNINYYGEKTKEIYQKKVKFLEEYISRENTMSKDALLSIRKDLKFEYFNNLIQPRNIPSSGRNFYFNEQDGLLPILQREAGESENIFYYEDYFGNIHIGDFTASPDISNTYYKNSINPFIRYYFLSSEDLPYTKAKFLAEKDFIEKHFDGEVRDYAIARMISDYHKKGFGYSTGNIQLVKDAIAEYEPRFTKESYISKMNEIIAELNNFNFKLSDKALNAQIVNSAGDTLKLKSILKGASKIKVLDLWASWCPPCIRDIRETFDFKKELKKEVDMQWIYLSLDTNSENWEKGSKDLRQNLNSENSYLIVGDFKSNFAKFFKINSIPRYIILDEKNNIILENAPSPFAQDNFKRMIDNISNN
ncbi:thioredoxin family protein [Gramella sp. AN32]|uniref:TlpA family protein disulfide reductase n=1 Tax=Christiangramia antarctica TaxID=2058158 RepID=A0ABW5X8P0_9FLAO|nr:thioredoxin family protein [Gramella sp. AN32]MCM4155816.1 hypothetical protein [Gramella sp. AN32]